MDAVTPKTDQKTEHSHVVRPANMEWQKTRFPGCEVKTLLFDAETGLVTVLTRFAPGAVLPDPGTYDFVFDTPTRRKPGAFAFRFWINDTSPPSIRLLGRTVIVGRPIRFAVRDSGSGVDPRSLAVTIGGRPARL